MNAAQTVVDTERLGLPSASSAHRWLSCHGSHAAELALPDQKSDDSTEGELLHAIVAGLAPRSVDLNDDQQFCIDFCLSKGEALAKELIGESKNPIETLVEQRLWLRDDDLQPMASARLDRIVICGNRALCIDWKFGRREVDGADTNAQLRFAAGVIAQERPEVGEIFVAIVAPRADGERVTVAHFTVQQARIAEFEMKQGARRAMLPDQPRIPSPKACYYCRARGTSCCPESIAASVALSVVPGKELSADTLAALLDRCDQADRVIDSIREEGKRRLASGVDVPGWRLKPGAVVRKIGDAREAWARIGVTIGGASFAECCTVSLPALAKAWKSQKKSPSEKAAREQVEALLGDAITEKENAASLARENQAA